MFISTNSEFNDEFMKTFRKFITDCNRKLLRYTVSLVGYKKRRTFWGLKAYPNRRKV